MENDEEVRDEETPEEAPEETPEPEPDPRDTRIVELEAALSEASAALEAANARISELSEGLIAVSGDIDQGAKDEPAPFSLMEAMRQT